MRELVTVIENIEITKNVFQMKFTFSKKARAGQFVNIKVDDYKLLLRRPISIMNIEEGFLTITYRVVGEGTRILSLKKPGDSLDILGPLGNGFPLHKGKSLLVGGGIGIPPLYELAKELKQNNCDVMIILAFKKKDELFYVDEFRSMGNVVITTDDGSEGFKGNAVDYLKKNNPSFDTIYACGPSKMLEGIDLLYQNKRTGYISFEERMACGLGICYGCTCKPKKLDNGMLRVCKEGPVFPLGVIDYD